MIFAPAPARVTVPSRGHAVNARLDGFSSELAAGSSRVAMGRDRIGRHQVITTTWCGIRHQYEQIDRWRR